MKKTILVFLCAILAASTMAGCGQSGVPGGSSTGGASSGTSSAGSSGTASGASNLTPAGEFPIVKEKATLTMASPDQAYIGKLEENDVIKWYEEKTNVHVVFNEIPIDAMKEKLNLMLVSGDLPDVLLQMGVTKDQETDYGAQGVFLDLRDLIEKYGVETKQMFEEYPLAKSSVTNPDGNIYALPKINDCFHCAYAQRAWINQTWLDKLGLKMPTTTTEFEAVLQAFKDGDPNGNGKADEIPLMGDAKSWNANPVPFLTSAFILQDGTTNLYVNDNKEVCFTANTQEYKDALTWIRSLVVKGLVDPTSFTQDGDQHNQIVQDPEAVKVGVDITANITGTAGQDTNTPDHRVRNYVGLPPLEGPNGYRGTPSPLTNAIAGGQYIITNKCKDPDLAFRWADGLLNEETTIIFQNGLEGVGWNKPAEGSTGLGGEPALYDVIVIPDEPVEQMRKCGNFFGKNTAAAREGQKVDYNDPDVIWQTEPVLYIASRDAYKPYAKYDNTLPSIYWLPEEAKEYIPLNTQITDYVKEQTTLFLLGERDIDKEWDAYVKEFEKLGLPRMMEILNVAYPRQYK